MASPQCEHGFTRIANELLHALTLCQVSGREFRVVLAVIRETYGYSRLVAPLSRTRLAEMCGLDRRDADRVVRALVAKKILHTEPGQGRSPGRIGLQKDYDLWDVVPNTPSQVVTAKTPSQTPAENVLVTATTPSQDGAKTPSQTGAYQYDKRKRKRNTARSGSEEALKVARAYHERIRILHPTLTRGWTEKWDQDGALALDDLVRIDDHDWEAVKDVLRWILTDDFWSRNMRSLASARKKGAGGSTKFESAMVQFDLSKRSTRVGVDARPQAVVRKLSETELAERPNCLGWK